MKHSKYRNTGIIFNLLARQSIKEAMAKKPLKSLEIIKKYFKKGTQLYEEYLLYKSLFSNADIDSHSLLINVITEERRKLDNKRLEREKYRLIGEIKNNYDLDILFKTKIDKYAHLANIYKIFEYKASENPKGYMSAYQSVLNEIKEPNPKNEEFDKFDELGIDYRKIAFKRLVERFNSQYKDINERQKRLIREFLNNPIDSSDFKDFIIREINYVKNAIKENLRGVKTKSLRIKLNEVAKMSSMIVDGTIKECHVKAMFKYYDLIEMLKNEE